MTIVRRYLPVALLLAALSLVHAADEAPRVTIDATDKPVAQVLAQLQAQLPRIQICATAATTANVTVKLTDASAEEAMRAVAKALKGSYLRGYIIERNGAGETPYTAAEYIDFTKAARDEWRKRLSPEQTQAFDARAREKFRSLGQNGQTMPRADALSYDDPLLRWSLSPTAEKISLDADGAGLQQALDLFAFASGYVVLLEDGVDGSVTLHEKDQELPPLLDKIAAAGQAHWRMFYLISQPVKLSEQDTEKRVDQAFGEMWGGFWSSPPEERARDIQRVVEGLKSIPPDRLEFIKALPIAQKMFTRMMKATTTLTPEQRKEFQPIMQAVAPIMGH